MTLRESSDLRTGMLLSRMLVPELFLVKWEILPTSNQGTITAPLVWGFFLCILMVQLFTAPSLVDLWLSCTQRYLGESCSGCCHSSCNIFIFTVCLFASSREHHCCFVFFQSATNKCIVATNFRLPFSGDRCNAAQHHRLQSRSEN